MTPHRTPTKTLLQYSPHPIEHYLPRGAGLLTPGTLWNLAYLSHDFEAGLPKDPMFAVHVRRTAQYRLDGSGPDLTGSGPLSSRVEGWLGLPAPRLVHLLMKHVVFHQLPLSQAYGARWEQTMLARSWLCCADNGPPDTFTDCSEAAAHIARIVNA